MGVAVDPKTGNPLGNVPQVLQFQNNFVPAQANQRHSIRREPSDPAADAGQLHGRSPALSPPLGGLNPSDFSSNPLPVGTPAPLVNASVTGTAVNNQAAVPAPITASTRTVGPAPSNSLTVGFAAGDSITVDGTTITFVASGATGNQLNVTDNVGALLNKIGAITGATAYRLRNRCRSRCNTGTAQDLNIVANTPNATNVLTGLGFATVPITQARAAGTNVGTGFVIANDLQTFTNEIHQRWRCDSLQLRWNAGEPADALGQDRQRHAWRPGTRTPGTCSIRPTPPRRAVRSAWVNTGTTFVFNASGALASPTGSSIAVPSVTVDGQSLGTLSLNIAAGALTQFASSSGAATINGITQNGFAAGQLQSVAVNNSGLVVGTFSNGQNIDLAAVTLSHFNGTNYLKALDGGAYEATDLSGVAILGASGSISGSSLEGSNTDIADEFTKLIVTQQAYSANTKVITTANDMVQSLLNVLR